MYTLNILYLSRVFTMTKSHSLVQQKLFQPLDILNVSFQRKTVLNYGEHKQGRNQGVS